MVGISLNWSSDPIAAAHATIRETNGDVGSVLRHATIPPRDSIPLVGDPTAKTGSWARYIGMVQDVWDAELFVALSSDGQSGLFIEDGAAGDMTNPNLAERLPVYLVSIPGETDWVRSSRTAPAAATAQPAPMQSSRPKRAREEDDVMEEHQAEPAVVQTQPVRSASASRPPSYPAAPAASAANAQDKRQRPEDLDAAQVPFAGMGLNLPLPAQKGGSAIVAKLYDNISGSGLKINSVVEVIGIMQDPLEIAANASGSVDSFAAEFAARNPTNVRRLHAVAIREVGEWELNPATERIGRTQGVAALDAARAELRSVLPALRLMIIRYLASALCDDVLAAEYLLMCLLSRPAQRTGAGGVLGKLSLNLVLPKEASEDASFMKNVAGAIEQIVPSVVRVEVNIAALNSMDLLPKKDYTANRLKAAPLQLATGSVLLADESKLSNGQLSERGVKNVRALTAVSQKLATPIDFSYYESELPVHCSAILVSTGGKSIVWSDVVVRVSTGTGGEMQKWNSYDECMLNKMRLAMGLLLENGRFDISDEAVAAVERAYVHARKQGQAAEGQETLQAWLAVARMCARSFGEDTLSKERWEYSMELETRRNRV